MRRSMTSILSVGCTAALLASATVPANAACTEFSFSVNDYGKDGPTRDAKLLLDKWIADWAQRVNLKKYKVGKKSVSCELFLNFIVFDEHTCKATAKVCWTGVPYEVLKARAAKNPPKKAITLTKADIEAKEKPKKAAKSARKKVKTATKKSATKTAAQKRARKPQTPVRRTAKPSARQEPAVQVVKVKAPRADSRKGTSISTGSIQPTKRKASSGKMSAARAAAIANAQAAAKAAAQAAEAAAAAARAAAAAAKLAAETK